jgi:hypothetical protein
VCFAGHASTIQHPSNSQNHSLPAALPHYPTAPTPSSHTRPLPLPSPSACACGCRLIRLPPGRAHPPPQQAAWPPDPRRQLDLQPHLQGPTGGRPLGARMICAQSCRQTRRCKDKKRKLGSLSGLRLTLRVRRTTTTTIKASASKASQLKGNSSRPHCHSPHPPINPFGPPPKSKPPHTTPHFSDRAPDSESRRSPPEPRLVPRPPRPVASSEEGRVGSAEAGVRPICCRKKGSLPWVLFSAARSLRGGGGGRHGEVQRVCSWGIAKVEH